MHLDQNDTYSLYRERIFNWTSLKFGQKYKKEITCCRSNNSAESWKSCYFFFYFFVFLIASRNPLKFSSQLTLPRQHFIIISKKLGQSDKLTRKPEPYLQTGTLPVKPKRMVSLTIAPELIFDTHVCITKRNLCAKFQYSNSNLGADKINCQISNILFWSVQFKLIILIHIF